MNPFRPEARRGYSSGCLVLDLTLTSEWTLRRARRAGVSAEVDGNRTRRTGITRPTRFEGGGAHQAPGHLHAPIGP